MKTNTNNTDNSAVIAEVTDEIKAIMQAMLADDDLLTQTLERADMGDFATYFSVKDPVIRRRFLMRLFAHYL